MEMPSFLLPANGQVSPESLQRRRRMAEGMLQSGIDTSPIASPWQGAARLAQALVGGLSMRNADKSEQEGRAGAQDAMLRAMAGGGNMNDAQTAELMGNPWLSEGQQAMVADKYKTAHAAPESKVLNEGDVWMSANGQEIGRGNPKQFAPEASPDIIQLYDWYNSEQAKNGLPSYSKEEFLQKYGPMLKRGTSVTVGDGLKLTEIQSKDLGFYARGTAADAELAPLENALTQFGSSAAAQSPQLIGNYLKSNEYQQAERAGREFLTVILRKDTGAAVTPAEWAMYGPMFLPIPGDKKEVLVEKKKARARAMRAIKLGLGNARGLAEEVDKELSVQPPASSPDQPVQPQGGDEGWTTLPNGVKIRQK
jgi:hypothetical protein